MTQDAGDDLRKAIRRRNMQGRLPQEEGET